MGLKMSAIEPWAVCNTKDANLIADTTSGSYEAMSRSLSRYVSLLEAHQVTTFYQRDTLYREYWAEN
jgi:hypothetical protein